MATSDEVAERPISVELLGERWALARLNGRLVAFADRFGLIWIAPDEPIVGLPNFPEWDDPSSTML